MRHLAQARNDEDKLVRGTLLPVIGQNLGAGPAQSGTVLLQARQNDLVAVIDVSAAKTRDVPRTGIMPLLRGGR
jgi:hypothetical protein